MIPVVYIGGFGRSGSTLLDRMLAQVPGCVAVGEVVHLLQRGLLDDERCGCGSPFSACDFWAEVGREAFGAGGWASVDGHGLRAVQQAVDRNRHIAAMLSPAAPTRFWSDLHRLQWFLRRLYTGVAAVSGARVVVDSSKHASTAFLLRGVKGIDLKVVHLVRDSRGVAYSWAKRVERPEVVGDTDLMPTYGPGRAGARWVAYNSLFHGLAASGVPTLPLRYEALVADPVASLTSVLELAGVPPQDGALGFLGDGWAELGVSHSVAGNPMRFRTGRLSLRSDDAWRQHMERRERRVVTAVTAPLLAGYGYVQRKGA